MSAEYSVEKIEESVTYLSNQYARSHDRRDAVACAQLQILAERIKADERAVPDEIVRKACDAYTEAAVHLHGEFARLNPIGATPSPGESE